MGTQWTILSFRSRSSITARKEIRRILWIQVSKWSFHNSPKCWFDWISDSYEGSGISSQCQISWKPLPWVSWQEALLFPLLLYYYLFLACNVILQVPQGLYTIRNHGRSINCTASVLFPTSLTLINMDVTQSGVNNSITSLQQSGLSSDNSSVSTLDTSSSLTEASLSFRKECKESGCTDYLEVRGGGDLDPLFMSPVANFCGSFDSNKESIPVNGTRIDVGCGNTAIRLVSSGKTNNSVTIFLDLFIDLDASPCPRRSRRSDTRFKRNIFQRYYFHGWRSLISNKTLQGFIITIVFTVNKDNVLPFDQSLIFQEFQLIFDFCLNKVLDSSTQLKSQSKEVSLEQTSNVLMDLDFRFNLPGFRSNWSRVTVQSLQETQESCRVCNDKVNNASWLSFLKWSDHDLWWSLTNDSCIHSSVTAAEVEHTQFLFFSCPSLWTDSCSWTLFVFLSVHSRSVFFSLVLDICDVSSRLSFHFRFEESLSSLVSIEWTHIRIIYCICLLSVRRRKKEKERVTEEKPRVSHFIYDFLSLISFSFYFLLLFTSFWDRSSL